MLLASEKLEILLETIPSDTSSLGAEPSWVSQKRLM
jgi:hypothetical protein